MGVSAENAPVRLLFFARRMTDEGKTLAVCAGPIVRKHTEATGVARSLPRFAELAAAVESVRAL
jgi:hypothetical protein